MKTLIWHCANGNHPAAMPAPGVHESARSTLVVIGNFDGVHRGHANLLAHHDHHPDLPLVVLTFDPHPITVLTQSPQRTLTRFSRKLELLAENGVQCVAVQPFDREFASLEARDFADSLLVKALHAQAVVIGENFRFGRKRMGDFHVLQKLGAELGFQTEFAPLLLDDGAPVSSSRIREAVSNGEMGMAARWLGRPHRIYGRVVLGDQLGRTLGFPTANLSGIEELLPPHGVYVVRLAIAGRDHTGVMNIGVRPTLKSPTPELRVEVHVLDLDPEQSDLYGKDLGVDILARVRAEQRFSSLDELKAQIARDVQFSLQWVATHEAATDRC